MLFQLSRLLRLLLLLLAVTSCTKALDPLTGSPSGNGGLPSTQITINGNSNAIQTFRRGEMLEVFWTTASELKQCAMSSHEGKSGQVKETFSEPRRFTLICDGIKVAETVAKMVSEDPVLFLANGQEESLVVTPGADVRLSWQTREALECRLNGKTVDSDVGSLEIKRIISSHKRTLVCRVANQVIQRELDVIVVTPPATQPNPATASIFADGRNSSQPFLSIVEGTRVLIAWQSSNAVSCRISELNTESLQGSQLVTVSKTSDFQIECLGAVGTPIARDTVHVVAVPPVVAPVRVANLRLGQNRIPYGTTTEVRWETSSVTNCRITPFDWRVSGSGSRQSPALTSNTEIKLECDADETNLEKVALVQVDPYAPATVDLKLNGDDNGVRVEYGTSVSLSWILENTHDCRLSDFAPPINASGASTIGPLERSRQFTMSCKDIGENLVSDSVRVIVNPPRELELSLSVGGNSADFTVEQGTSLRVIWSSQNATNCSLTPLAETGISGDTTFVLDVQTTVTLRCEGLAGRMEKSITVSPRAIPNRCVAEFKQERCADFASADSLDLMTSSGANWLANNRGISPPSSDFSILTLKNRGSYGSTEEMVTEFVINSASSDEAMAGILIFFRDASNYTFVVANPRLQRWELREVAGGTPRLLVATRDNDLVMGTVMQLRVRTNFENVSIHGPYLEIRANSKLVIAFAYPNSTMDYYLNESPRQAFARDVNDALVYYGAAGIVAKQTNVRFLYFYVSLLYRYENSSVAFTYYPQPIRSLPLASGTPGSLQTGGEIVGCQAKEFVYTGEPNSPSDRHAACVCENAAVKVVWGGFRNVEPGEYHYKNVNLGRDYTDGGIYNKATRQWAKVAIKDSPTPRSCENVHWTGKRLVVWAGLSTAHGPRTYAGLYVGAGLAVLHDYSRRNVTDGGIYDPASGVWSRFLISVGLWKTAYDLNDGELRTAGGDRDNGAGYRPYNFIDYYDLNALTMPR